MSATTKKAVRGNPQPPVRIKFEKYLTPSYTEAGISYHQNVRKMTCDCPHWKRNHDRGTPIVCKHLQNAIIAAHFEAVELARELPSQQLVTLSMKYQQFPHIRQACLLVLWEREHDCGADQPGFQEFIDRIGQLEGEIQEIVEERSTMTFSQSIAADTQTHRNPEDHTTAGHAEDYSEARDQATEPETPSDPRITAINDQIAALEEEIRKPYDGTPQSKRRIDSLYEKIDRLQGRKKFLAAEGALARINDTRPRSDADNDALKEMFR